MTGSLTLDQVKLIELTKWGRCVKWFIYTLLFLGYMNDIARADYTVPIAVIGLLALWFQKKSAALLFFYSLFGTAFLDATWLAVHGHYLDRFGKIPFSAPEAIVDLMRLHKWSLGMSIVVLVTKVLALYPSWKYYHALDDDEVNDDILKLEKSLNKLNYERNDQHYTPALSLQPNMNSL